MFHPIICSTLSYVPPYHLFHPIICSTLSYVSHLSYVPHLYVGKILQHSLCKDIVPTNLVMTYVGNSRGVVPMLAFARNPNIKGNVNAMKVEMVADVRRNDELQDVTTVRRTFPETWLWTSKKLGY